MYLLNYVVFSRVLISFSKEMGRRRLKNTVLDFLSCEKTTESATRFQALYNSADCMTDRLGALSTLISHDCPERDAALENFYKFAKGECNEEKVREISALLFSVKCPLLR
jgi:hypothetical protein